MSEQEIERAKQLLEEYYKVVNSSDKSAVADAYEQLKLVAENLVDFITDVIYWE